MLLSKRKEHKTIGPTSLAPGIFTIVEPVIYGLPLALNPYLIVPFILSGTIANGVGYLLMSSDLFGKFYALVPWATPPFLLGPIGTGDWKTILIVVISFIIGFVYVDRFEHTLNTMKRYKKKSFYWYKQVIASNGNNLENDIDY